LSAVGAALAPLPQPGFGITGRGTRLFNKVNATPSNIPTIWTAWLKIAREAFLGFSFSPCLMSDLKACTLQEQSFSAETENVHPLNINAEQKKVATGEESDSS
jgi:hypothetical protein